MPQESMQDQGHPHVHVVMKAMSERGERLNIYKATLREWRRDFAGYLREFGVEANATERAVRGSPHQTRRSGISRATARGQSTFMWARAASIARELHKLEQPAAPGESRLLRTRFQVERGWLDLADSVARDGMQDLAAQIRRFVDRMPRVLTDRQWIAEHIRSVSRERAPRADRLLHGSAGGHIIARA